MPHYDSDDLGSGVFFDEDEIPAITVDELRKRLADPDPAPATWAVVSEVHAALYDQAQAEADLITLSPAYPAFGDRRALYHAAKRFVSATEHLNDVLQ